MNLKWISSGGGPYICTTQLAAASWKGTDGLSLQTDTIRYQSFDRSRSLPGHESTDYGRACLRNDFAWKLPGQDNDIMVVNDLPSNVTWHPLGASSGLIVKWVGADSDEHVVGHLSTLDNRDYERLPFDIDFIESDLILFDSAWTLKEIGNNKIEFNVEPGSYSVLNRIYRPDDSIELHLLKLVLAASLR